MILAYSSYDGQPQGNNLGCPATRCPNNSYGAPMLFSRNSAADGTNRLAHELRTGRSIPVDVLAELDRKIDDGIPRTGNFQVDQNVNAGSCRTGAGAASTYDIVANNPQSDCAGVHIL